MRPSPGGWALLPALAAAAVLPLPRPPGHVDELGRSNVQPDASDARATFAVPCFGCLGAESGDDALSFDLRVSSSALPCGPSNVTLNGEHLASEWLGTTGTGLRRFRSRSGSTTRDLSLAWTLYCLFDGVAEHRERSQSSGVAQLLTVTIHRVNGSSVPGSQGFTVSYKQSPQPQLLRFAAVPVLVADDQTLAEWRRPPPHLRLPPQHHQDDTPGDAGLEEPSIRDQVRELELLRDTHTRQEAKSVKEKLRQCESVTCVLKTLAHEARGAAKSVCAKLRPAQSVDMSQYRDGYQEPSIARPAATMVSPYERHHPEHFLDHSRDSPGMDLPPSSEDFGPGTHHAHEPSLSSSKTEDGRPRHLLFKALAVLASAACLMTLLLFLHRHCCSPRRRADRRANREERRRARDYRRIARRQAWRDWWRRLRRRQHQECPADYEEKRALVLEQERVLDIAMRQEIRQLRAAHAVVNALVLAEEGRALPRAPDRACPPRATASGPRSRTSSLPDYRSEAGSTAPPAYGADADAGGTVVDGFREYFPCSATVWTPGSSIPDVSPRPSAETLREPYMQI